MTLSFVPRIGTGPFSRALVLENPDPTLDDHLRAAGVEPFRPDTTPNEAQLVRLLEAEPYDLLFKRSRVPVTPRVLDAAPNLSAVMLCCIGDDSVDKQACADRGVLVINDPVSNGRSVVELVIGEMICLSRRIFEAVGETGGDKFLKSQNRRFEILGKTLGIFGLGNIGKEVAKAGEALGMTVVFHDNRELARELGETMGWTFVPTLGELFALADIVTCHVSAYDYQGRSNDAVLRYEHFRELSAKDWESPRIFINLARGGIHSAGDLIRAVEDGHVARAMVDVFPEEPRSGDEAWRNPYAGNPRILGTPHIGASTLEAQPRIASHVARTTKMLSHHGRLRNCVFGGREEVGIDALGAISNFVTVVHSTERGTKSAVDGAIYKAGASNLISSHRDFDRYGIAYEVIGTDKPLSDDAIEGLIAEAVGLIGDPRAIRAIRQM